MLIYLDMCCLKRPFDDQSQPRVRLETEAVLALLAMESERIRFVRSAALLLENSLNPMRDRASRVEQWLSGGPLWMATNPQSLGRRVLELTSIGLKSFDALHVASAEQAGADHFATTDDRLLAVLRRIPTLPTIRSCSVIECAQEMSK